MWGRIFLYSPGTCIVDRLAFSSQRSTTSALWVLGLQAWITMTVLLYFWFLETAFLCTALTVPKQAGSEWTDSPAFASWVLGLKVYNSMLLILFCLINKAQQFITFLLNHFSKSWIHFFYAFCDQIYGFTVCIKTENFSDFTSPNILKSRYLLYA